MSALSVRLGPLELANPVMTASGTFGYGAEYSEFVDLNRLGAVVVKGISLEPMPGNPVPRVCETPCGMLNAIGLQNVGLDVFLREKLPFLRRYDTRVIVNILGNTAEDYVRLAAALEEGGVDAVELNVSCPNVKAGGIAFGTRAEMLGELVRAVRQETNLPLITKLSPNVTSVVDAARVAREAGSDAVSLINTLRAMAIDVETRRPRLASTTGGLSGPAVRPVAVRMVWEVCRNVDIPIIGMGGIASGDDALEFILAGASAVAVGTANFVNPRATMDVLSGIEAYLERHGVSTLSELVGTVR